MDGERDQEVVFKDTQEESALPTPVTTVDMDVIIRGWEDKFAKLTECLREVQLASERTGSDVCLINQEARAQTRTRSALGNHAGGPHGLPAKI